jgi:hypothetical protein
VRFFHPTAKQALMQSARDAERALREERRRAGDHSMLSERGSRRGSISHDATEKSLQQTSRSHVGSEMGSVRTARTGKSDHKAHPPAISVEQLRRDLLERERAEAEQRRVEAQARMVVKAQQKREADFQAVQQRLKDEERDFVSKVDQYLSDKDKSHHQKRRALHQNWTECVFNKIQDQLLDRVDTMDPEEISERRRVLFQNYIDAAARKGGGLFLDIVIENEYDPFTWKTHTLRCAPGRPLSCTGPCPASCASCGVLTRRARAQVSQQASAGVQRAGVPRPLWQSSLRPRQKGPGEAQDRGRCGDRGLRGRAAARRREVAAREGDAGARALV